MDNRVLKYIYRCGALTGALFIVFIILPLLIKTNYTSSSHNGISASIINSINTPDHVITPLPLKAIYISSWVAGTPHLRDNLIDIINTTEINSVVIDIKDYSGKISFDLSSKIINDIGSTEQRIKNVEALIHIFHEKNIYVVGRIVAFQDSYLSEKWKSEAVLDKSDNNMLWKDENGNTWVDPSSQKTWDYLIDIAELSYKIGFDEINFDYVEFPDDINNNAYFPISNDVINKNSKSSTDITEDFFSYVNKKLSSKVVTSIDLSRTYRITKNDLVYKQIFESALLYFDFVSPVVFPSYYPQKWNDYDNPALEPYEVIKYSMEKIRDIATKNDYTQNNIRPWLQDFDLGATYTKDMVLSEIQAVYDSGFVSWMMWDPANTYTKDALVIE